MVSQPHDPIPDGAVEHGDISLPVCSLIPDTYELLLS
jgi:hypothetical protein